MTSFRGKKKNLGCVTPTVSSRHYKLPRTYAVSRLLYLLIALRLLDRAIALCLLNRVIPSQLRFRIKLDTCEGEGRSDTMKCERIQTFLKASCLTIDRLLALAHALHDILGQD